MAKNRVDTCMFCSCTPCECNKQAKKVAPVRRVQPKATQSDSADSVTATKKPAQAAPTSAPIIKPVIRPRPARVQPPIQVKPPTQPRPGLEAVVRAQEEYTEALGKAITVFAELEMLHRDELQKHRKIISLPDHVIDRMIWRQDVEQSKLLPE